MAPDVSDDGGFKNCTSESDLACPLPLFSFCSFLYSFLYVTTNDSMRNAMKNTQNSYYH
jgi:hypothetical protein